LCNCDDPGISNFFYYFVKNFAELGLKKLIAAHFEPDKPGSVLEYEGGIDAQGDKETVVHRAMLAGKKITPELNTETKPARFVGGDFRSPESIALLRESDIVVTNPPFSLFREYIALLIAHTKKFIIIGNINVISYKEIFPLIKENRIWLGPSIHSGDREFQVPPHYPLNAAGCRADAKGDRFIRVKGVRWFTNLDFDARHTNLILSKSYNPSEYPRYDNYDAVNVDTVKEIPRDYSGAMGVPITFMDKYNPDQFEIMDANILRVSGSVPYKEHGLIKDKESAIHGKPVYVRMVIRNRHPEE